MLTTQSNKDELEKLKRELRFAKEKADELEQGKASELSAMLSKYNREMADLEEALHVDPFWRSLLRVRQRREHWKKQVEEFVITTVSLRRLFVRKRKNLRSTRLAWIPLSFNSKNFSL